MKARRLVEILNVPKAERQAMAVEGLGLLGEHIGALHGDLTHLVGVGRPRAAAVVDVLASEEAAKMLILLDMVRHGWDDQEVTRQQVSQFYDHLARGLYARIVDGRPADFNEVRRYADMWRKSHYLDGPNDVDWIFRNEVLAEREDSMYVDYVTSEDQKFWSTPASRADLEYMPPPSMIIELAVALTRAGCAGAQGVEVIAKAWRGVVVVDDTHWSVIEKINRDIVAELHELGLVSPSLTGDDLRLVYEQWTFPLATLNLRESKVSGEELQDQRDQWLASQW